MHNQNLALYGGSKSIDFFPEPFIWFEQEDLSGLKELLETQRLSGFLAQPGDSFFGGENVKMLENHFCGTHKKKYAVTFNSWTSGLEATFLALDLPKGSEVIVPTWTMSATIASVLLAELVPVFCDVELQSFNLDPIKIPELINPNTRAICVVDIFGRPANWPVLRKLADDFNLILIVDGAQTPNATIEGKRPIEFADIGGYSFNRHKHLQVGEGGIVLTDDPIYSNRLQAIRNHGEVSRPEITLSERPLIGRNWRLGEMEAYLAYRQSQRLSKMIEPRRDAALELINQLRILEGLTIPILPSNLSSDYYILGMLFDERLAGFSRDFAVEALRAEGVDFVIGRYSEIKDLPVYRNLPRGDLTITTQLNEEIFLGLYLCGYQFDENLIASTVAAFKKVWNR